MKAARIQVRQIHINTAIKKDSNHCMIVDAVKAHFPKAKFISVDLQTIRFTNLELMVRYTFLTPPQAQLALLKFDQGEKLNPFEFTMRDPTYRKAGWGVTDPEKIKKQRTWKSRQPNYKPNGRSGRVKEREYGLRKFVK